MEGVKFTPSFLQSAVSTLQTEILLNKTELVCTGMSLLLLLMFGFLCQGLNVNQVYNWSFIAALCYHAYQQVSPLAHMI